MKNKKLKSYHARETERFVLGRKLGIRKLLLRDYTMNNIKTEKKSTKTNSKNISKVLLSNPNISMNKIKTRIFANKDPRDCDICGVEHLKRTESARPASRIVSVQTPLSSLRKCREQIGPFISYPNIERLRGGQPNENVTKEELIRLAEAQSRNSLNPEVIYKHSDCTSNGAIFGNNTVAVYNFDVSNPEIYKGNSTKPTNYTPSEQTPDSDGLYSDSSQCSSSQMETQSPRSKSNVFCKINSAFVTKHQHEIMNNTGKTTFTIAPVYTSNLIKNKLKMKSSVYVQSSNDDFPQSQKTFETSTSRYIEPKAMSLNDTNRNQFDKQIDHFNEYDHLKRNDDNIIRISNIPEQFRENKFSNRNESKVEIITKIYNDISSTETVNSLKKCIQIKSYPIRDAKVVKCVAESKIKADLESILQMKSDDFIDRQFTNDRIFETIPVKFNDKTEVLYRIKGTDNESDPKIDEAESVKQEENAYQVALEKVKDETNHLRSVVNNLETLYEFKNDSIIAKIHQMGFGIANLTHEDVLGPTVEKILKNLRIFKNLPSSESEEEPSFLDNFRDIIGPTVDQSIMKALTQVFRFEKHSTPIEEILSPRVINSSHSNVARDRDSSHEHVGLCAADCFNQDEPRVPQRTSHRYKARILMYQHTPSAVPFTQRWNGSRTCHDLRFHKKIQPSSQRCYRDSSPSPRVYAGVKKKIMLDQSRENLFATYPKAVSGIYFTPVRSSMEHPISSSISHHRYGSSSSNFQRVTDASHSAYPREENGDVKPPVSRDLYCRRHSQPLSNADSKYGVLGKSYSKINQRYSRQGIRDDLKRDGFADPGQYYPSRSLNIPEDSHYQPRHADKRRSPDDINQDAPGPKPFIDPWIQNQRNVYPMDNSRRPSSRIDEPISENSKEAYERVKRNIQKQLVQNPTPRFNNLRDDEILFHETNKRGYPWADPSDQNDGKMGMSVRVGSKVRFNDRNLGERQRTYGAAYSDYPEDAYRPSSRRDIQSLDDPYFMLGQRCPVENSEKGRQRNNYNMEPERQPHDHSHHTSHTDYPMLHQCEDSYYYENHDRQQPTTLHQYVGNYGPKATCPDYDELRMYPSLYQDHNPPHIPPKTNKGTSYEECRNNHYHTKPIYMQDDATQDDSVREYFERIKHLPRTSSTNDMCSLPPFVTNKKQNYLDRYLQREISNHPEIPAVNSYTHFDPGYCGRDPIASVTKMDRHFEKLKDEASRGVKVPLVARKYFYMKDYPEESNINDLRKCGRSQDTDREPAISFYQSTKADLGEQQIQWSDTVDKGFKNYPDVLRKRPNNGTMKEANPLDLTEDLDMFIYPPSKKTLKKKLIEKMDCLSSASVFDFDETTYSSKHDENQVKLGSEHYLRARFLEESLKDCERQEGFGSLHVVESLAKSNLRQDLKPHKGVEYFRKDINSNEQKLANNLTLHSAFNKKDTRNEKSSHNVSNEKRDHTKNVSDDKPFKYLIPRIPENDQSAKAINLQTLSNENVLKKYAKERKQSESKLSMLEFFETYKTKPVKEFTKKLNEIAHKELAIAYDILPSNHHGPESSSQNEVNKSTEDLKLLAPKRSKQSMDIAKSGSIHKRFDLYENHKKISKIFQRIMSDMPIAADLNPISLKDTNIKTGFSLNEIKPRSADFIKSMESESKIHLNGNLGQLDANSSVEQVNSSSPERRNNKNKENVVTINHLEKCKINNKIGSNLWTRWDQDLRKNISEANKKQFQRMDHSKSSEDFFTGERQAIARDDGELVKGNKFKDGNANKSNCQIFQIYHNRKPPQPEPEHVKRSFVKPQRESITYLVSAREKNKSTKQETKLKDLRLRADSVILKDKYPRFSNVHILYATASGVNGSTASSRPVTSGGPVTSAVEPAEKLTRSNLCRQKTGRRHYQPISDSIIFKEDSDSDEPSAFCSNSYRGSDNSKDRGGVRLNQNINRKFNSDVDHSAQRRYGQHTKSSSSPKHKGNWQSEDPVETTLESVRRAFMNKVQDRPNTSAGRSTHSKIYNIKVTNSVEDFENFDLIQDFMDSPKREARIKICPKVIALNKQEAPETFSNQATIDRGTEDRKSAIKNDEGITYGIFVKSEKINRGNDPIILKNSNVSISSFDSPVWKAKHSSTKGYILEKSSIIAETSPLKMMDMQDISPGVSAQEYLRQRAAQNIDDSTQDIAIDWINYSLPNGYSEQHLVNNMENDISSAPNAPAEDSLPQKKSFNIIKEEMFVSCQIFRRGKNKRISLNDIFVDFVREENLSRAEKTFSKTFVSGQRKISRTEYSPDNRFYEMVHKLKLYGMQYFSMKDFTVENRLLSRTEFIDCQNELFLKPVGRVRRSLSKLLRNRLSFTKNGEKNHWYHRDEIAPIDDHPVKNSKLLSIMGKSIIQSKVEDSKIPRKVGNIGYPSKFNGNADSIKLKKPGRRPKFKDIFKSDVSKASATETCDKDIRRLTQHNITERGGWHERQILAREVLSMRNCVILNKEPTLSFMKITETKSQSKIDRIRNRRKQKLYALKEKDNTEVCYPDIDARDPCIEPCSGEIITTTYLGEPPASNDSLSLGLRPSFVSRIRVALDKIGPAKCQKVASKNANKNHTKSFKRRTEESESIKNGDKIMTKLKSTCSVPPKSSLKEKDMVICGKPLPIEDKIQDDRRCYDKKSKTKNTIFCKCSNDESEKSENDSTSHNKNNDIKRYSKTKRHYTRFGRYIDDKFDSPPEDDTANIGSEKYFTDLEHEIVNPHGKHHEDIDVEYPHTPEYENDDQLIRYNNDNYGPNINDSKQTSDPSFISSADNLHNQTYTGVKLGSCDELLFPLPKRNSNPVVTLDQNNVNCECPSKNQCLFSHPNVQPEMENYSSPATYHTVKVLKNRTAKCRKMPGNRPERCYESYTNDSRNFCRAMDVNPNIEDPSRHAGYLSDQFYQKLRQAESLKRCMSTVAENRNNDSGGILDVHQYPAIERYIGKTGVTPHQCSISHIRDEENFYPKFRHSTVLPHSYNNNTRDDQTYAEIREMRNKIDFTNDNAACGTIEYNRQYATNVVPVKNEATKPNRYLKPALKKRENLLTYYPYIAQHVPSTKPNIYALPSRNEPTQRTPLYNNPYNIVLDYDSILAFNLSYPRGNSYPSNNATQYLYKRNHTFKYNGTCHYLITKSPRQLCSTNSFHKISEKDIYTKECHSADSFGLLQLNKHKNTENISKSDSIIKWVSPNQDPPDLRCIRDTRTSTLSDDIEVIVDSPQTGEDTNSASYTHIRESKYTCNEKGIVYYEFDSSTNPFLKSTNYKRINQSCKTYSSCKQTIIVPTESSHRYNLKAENWTAKTHDEYFTKTPIRPCSKFDSCEHIVSNKKCLQPNSRIRRQNIEKELGNNEKVKSYLSDTRTVQFYENQFETIYCKSENYQRAKLYPLDLKTKNTVHANTQTDWNMTTEPMLTIACHDLPGSPCSQNDSSLSKDIKRVYRNIVSNNWAKISNKSISSENSEEKSPSVFDYLKSWTMDKLSCTNKTKPLSPEDHLTEEGGRRKPRRVKCFSSISGHLVGRMCDHMRSDRHHSSYSEVNLQRKCKPKAKAGGDRLRTEVVLNQERKTSGGQERQIRTQKPSRNRASAHSSTEEEETKTHNLLDESGTNDTRSVHESETSKTPRNYSVNPPSASLENKTS